MGRFPLTDVQETSCAYLIEAELPGYDEKSVDVHVNGGILTIESKPEEEAQTGAQEKPEPETPQSGFSFRERRRGTFTRSFKLPEDADAEQITAGFKNGILSLEIKKCAEARKRVIQIEKR
jgi:HSP20 family protein